MTPSGRRIRIDLSYDGTDYRGWQVQPDGPTIQGVLEDRLARLAGGEPARTRGAGRTDAGVHARGQVVDAWIETRLDDAAVLRALLALLPADIRPLAVATVPDGFHARRDAVAKTYRYRLDRSPSGDPFAARFALAVPRELDLDAVRDALGRLPGKRDWSGFAGAACAVAYRVRTLTDARLEGGTGSEIALAFRADGFLNHMVRNLVGTVLEVGRGRFRPDRIDAILESGDRTLAGPTAPARGLCLERVEYERRSSQ